VSVLHRTLTDTKFESLYANSSEVIDLPLQHRPACQRRLYARACSSTPWNHSAVRRIKNHTSRSHVRYAMGLVTACAISVKRRRSLATVPCRIRRTILATACLILKEKVSSSRLKEPCHRSFCAKCRKNSTRSLVTGCWGERSL